MSTNTNNNSNEEYIEIPDGISNRHSPKRSDLIKENVYIKKTKGPCVILAGAGTGKTYSLVQKLKYLLENKIYEPERIVCLTFSNEATNSLRERILPILKDDREPIIRTFHSFCSDLLRKYGNKISINDNFKILLPDDAKIMLHKSFKLQPNLCDTYVKEIGIAKDLGITLESLEKYLEENKITNAEEILKNIEINKFHLHTSHIHKSSFSNNEALKKNVEALEKRLKLIRFVQAWKSYEKLKEKKNVLDYSDLNKKALELLKKHSEIAHEFDYVIVDEFQDTNKLQCDFLYVLAPHKNITIVGDINQSIYRFRGAYKDNVASFKKAMNIKDTDIFNLDKSYRSTNKILQTAYELISNNYLNKEECFPVFSAFDKAGDKIKVYELINNKEEVRKIAEIINDEIARGVPVHEICVMFRTHQQAKMLKSYLDFLKIPYTSISNKPLLKSSIVRQIRAYLTILQKLSLKSKGGDSSWWDLFHLSDFSNTDLIKLVSFIKDNKDSDCISIKAINSLEAIEISEKGKIQLKALLKIIKNLIPESKKPIIEIMKKIYSDLGITPESASEKKEEIMILEKFYAIAKEFSETESNELASFLAHLDVIDALQIEIEAPSLENMGVRIMTSHATKGLEYETVILTNLVQRKFPIERINNSLIPSELSPEISAVLSSMPKELHENFIKEHEYANQLLEERRLCYVGFTRAKSNLYLTYAQEYNSRKHTPSQFLHEINYKDNQNIEFIQDTEEKFQNPIETKEIQNLEVQIPNERTVFSPTSLKDFDECQKKYEYRYIYKMPDPEPVSWDLVKLGSFVHKILEEGVKNQFKEIKQFIDLSKTIQMDENWSFVNLEEAIPIIKVFYERNKNKYNSSSLTEAWLSARIDGFEFHGKADRIDFTPDGLEIIDYKTGKTSINPKYRNWQLGFYAIASRKLGIPRKLTLDMLQKETPMEFVTDSFGNAKEIHSSRTSFNLNQVRGELVSTAKQIMHCTQTNSFKPCPPEKNCSFCEEWVY